MAQTNPSSSRPTAVTICGLFFPWPAVFGSAHAIDAGPSRRSLSLLRSARPDVSEGAAQPGPELISPGGFDDDASQVRVAGLGDGAPPFSFAAGVFAGNQAAVSHQLPGFRKARDLPQFSDDGHRRDLRNASQRLQSFDHRAHLGWRRARCLQDRLIQPFDAGYQVLDLMDVVGERNLLGGLLEMNFVLIHCR